MRRLAFVLMLALAAACGGGASSQGTAADARPAPRRSANVVMADEIVKHGGHNLYDILRALRPAWFNTSPTRMTGRGVYVDAVAVYVDGFRVGTPANLGDIPVSSVLQVRYYSASEAQGRFGLGNLQGAIEVITTR
jgi:hypothetical protein